MLQLSKAALVAFLLCASIANSCGAEVVERFDLRSRLNDPSEYYVVICARKSEPWGSGHTFVVLIHEDAVSGDTKSTGFGFYPGVEKVVVRLFVGRGTVADESTKCASVKPWLLTHRIIFRVDREAFESALAVREKWNAAGYDYHLFNRNCTHFGYAICQAIESEAPGPTRGERPPQYVERLMAYDWQPSMVREPSGPVVVTISDR